MNGAIGILEVKSNAAAIHALDQMVKAAQVQYLHTEKTLGGGLVTVIVQGDPSSVQAAIDAGVQAANEIGQVAAYEVIARPHQEIMKFFIKITKKKS